MYRSTIIVLTQLVTAPLKRRNKIYIQEPVT